MADPLSVAGLAIGVASLAFELFSGCVKGYNLILTAKEMPEACRYLMVRLRMEKEKLLGWAILAGLSEDDDTLKSTLKMNRHTLIDALREMQILLLDVSKMDARYNLQLIVDNSDDEPASDPTPPTQLLKIEERAVRFFDKTRRFPTRLKWAAFRKEKFEDLLANIAHLNDSMMRFLESHDRERHLKMQEITLMQVLQVSHRISDLFELVKSLKKVEVAAKEDRRNYVESEGIVDESQTSYEKRAVLLTRFTAIKLAIESEGDSRVGEIGTENEALLSIEKLHLQSVSEKLDGIQPQRSCGTYDGKPVWLEWRYYEPSFNSDAEESDEEEPQPPPFVENRISKMTKLLRDQEKPQEFRVPKCLGYVDDRRNCRLSFVYALDSSSEPTVPVSLSDLLLNRRKPSLTTRIRIARLVSSSIWYLHSTQWLHKGLRSDNIVFPQLDASGMMDPLLCGFDYSRPADVDETTERPLQNLWHDLYRHPRTQFDNPREGRRGFRKLFDIYALGVILAEIGTWRPVHDIVGIDRKSDQRPKTAKVKSVQTELLSKEVLLDIEAEAGDVFASVVKACISGDFVTNDINGKGDPDLQLDFWEKVIRPLENIAV
ncbi:prion-inhibition and propagation-domain-containing protein [Podospora australis]|uniref:Prion-inhibition and propagation-domain-containing protein n=1 Tax=Podospora australis TaxID=1536484 RepID=A0AAN6WME3_9PEZI|nr:prion-inhibition and propagation-domain-containing protein [Podospora australis]